jgi:hypothetical protein
MKKVKAYDQYREEDPPSKLLEFREFLDRIIEKIPGEYRHSAKIEFFAENSDIDIRITFERPFTPEEQVEHDELKRQRQAVYERREREEYEKLKLKFEGGAK